MDEKQRQHFEETGFVDFGYISPELSSADEYPAYIKENVKECVDKIQSHQNRKSITFGLWADVHFSPNFNHNMRMKRAVNSYREIANKVHCDKLILNGDHCNDGIREYKLNCYHELRNFIKEFDYFPTDGNHDVNSIWDEFLDHDEVINRISVEELYIQFFNHLPALGAKFDKNYNSLYYYHDDTVKNVRYIFLDTSDIPPQHQNGKPQFMCISQQQLDWLINEALNVPKGTDILVFAHDAVFPEKEETTDDQNLVMVNRVLDAYKNGEKLSLELDKNEFKISVDVDFSKVERGNIIALFLGHWHDDFVKYSKGNIPFIYTANFMMYTAREDVPRTDGNKSELSYDIVTVNRDEKTIYLTKVGAGNDVTVKYE